VHAPANAPPNTGGGSSRDRTRAGIVVAPIFESLNALFMALLRLGSAGGFRSLDSPGNLNSLSRA